MRSKYISSELNENINPMSVEDFYASIERAEDDIRSGRIYTQEEVENESENW